MSIAASALQLEPSLGDHLNQSATLSLERNTGKLQAEDPTSLLQSSVQPVVAVDLDDVLSKSNELVANWHNAQFGTNMTIADFYYYYYWKNPFWGSLEETFEKVNQFYATRMLYEAEPVLGAREGVKKLREMGYRLIVVTARSRDEADDSWKWVESNFPGIFDQIICTGQFQDANKTGHEVVTKLNKAQVCQELKARFLIDDSAENALQCVNSSKPTPVLLFGNYEWNRRVSGLNDAREDMTYEIRLKNCGGYEFWKDEELEVAENTPLWRVNGWDEVVEWVQNARINGRM